MKKLQNMMSPKATLFSHNQPIKRGQKSIALWLGMMFEKAAK